MSKDEEILNIDDIIGENNKEIQLLKDRLDSSPIMFTKTCLTIKSKIDTLYKTNNLLYRYKELLNKQK